MATLRQRNGSWLLTWSDAAGQHRRVIGRSDIVSKREAENALKELEYKLIAGRNPAASAIPSFRAYVEEYLAWHLNEHPASNPRVAQLFRTHLVPTFGLDALDQITATRTEQYKHDRLRAGAAVGTVTKELLSLKAALNRAVEWQIIPRHQLATVKAPKQLKSSPRHFYTVSELERLYGSSPFHGAIWKFLANTGLRRTEAMQLKWSQVSKTHILILSDVGARTKSAQYRKIPLSPGAREALISLKLRTGKSTLVLPNITLPSMSRAFRKCAKRAGLPGSLHSLRHTFCSHLAMNGAAATTIKTLAGHSTLRVTEAYMHLSPAFLKDSVKSLDL